MRHAASINSQAKDTRPMLYAVPAPDKDDRPLTAAVLLDDAFDQLPAELSTTWPGESSLDRALLALGFAVAVPVGDDLPDPVDETVDVHEAAVVNIESARLRRFLSQMDPLQSKVMRLHWGLDGPVHSQHEVAARTGLSRAVVRRLLDAGLAELRTRFGVSPSAA